MSKLTDAQINALKSIEKWGYSTRVNFKVGEALRKRGLVTRYTTYSVRAVFATKDGEHDQYNHSPDDPVISHEWDITPAGRSALTRSNSKGGDTNGQ